MRFVGLTEIATFIAQCPSEAEAVRAWHTEMKQRTWASPATLASDFPSADASHLPLVIFYLGPVSIETLINFRNGIVMLTEIRRRVLKPDLRRNWTAHGNH